MSQEKSPKEPKFRNSVKLVGYLKETTLQERTSKDGKQFITGTVTVAINEFNTQRVRFTAFKEDNETKYEELSKFLPSKTVTIASYLQSTPTAVFETASKMAAKVWVMAGFEEYAVRKGENERTSVLLRGYTIGASDPQKNFIPSATFEVDVYLKDIQKEVEDDVETGRLLIETVVPAYNDLVYVLPLVAPVEDNSAKFILEKYKVGETVRFSGDLVAMKVEEPAETTDNNHLDGFGRATEPQVTTHFVREYVIRGGIKQEKLTLSTEAVKKGMAKRDVLMVENGKRENKSKDGNAAKTETAAPAEAKPAPAKKAADTNGDFDF